MHKEETVNVDPEDTDFDAEKKVVVKWSVEVLVRRPDTHNSLGCVNHFFDYGTNEKRARLAHGDIDEALGWLWTRETAEVVSNIFV